MCLITEQEKPIILDEDLTVFKLVNNDMTSLLQKFKYEYDELYTTIIKRDNKFLFNSSIEHKYYMINRTSNNKLFSYSEGFHSYKTKSKVVEQDIEFILHNRPSINIIVKCIIPKGSQVYYDECDNVVSNKIIIKEDYEKECYKEYLKATEEAALIEAAELLDIDEEEIF